MERPIEEIISRLYLRLEQSIARLSLVGNRAASVLRLYYTFNLVEKMILAEITWIVDQRKTKRILLAVSQFMAFIAYRETLPISNSLEYVAYGKAVRQIVMQLYESDRLYRMYPNRHDHRIQFWSGFTEKREYRTLMDVLISMIIPANQVEERIHCRERLKLRIKELFPKKEAE